MPKVHFQNITRRGSVIVTGTLCDRMVRDGDINSTDVAAAVTCKICSARLPELTQRDMIALARSMARNAGAELHARAAGGTKARPTVAELNRTLDRLSSIDKLLTEALGDNACEAAQ